MADPKDQVKSADTVSVMAGTLPQETQKAAPAIELEVQPEEG